MRDRFLACSKCLHVPRGWVSVLLVWLIAVMLYGVIASSSSLWDRDEPRFSRAAVEMLYSGDWLVPHFNEGLRPDKPILIYWFMSAGVWLLGVTELAVRWPSVVALPTTGVVVYLLGKRLAAMRFAAGESELESPSASEHGMEQTYTPHRVGMWAMVMLLTAVVPTYIGTAATADGVLLLCVTLSLWAMVEAVLRGEGRGSDQGSSSWRWWLLAAVALGFAQLVKGPVALGIFVLTGLGIRRFGWRIFEFNAKLIWGWLIAMLIGTVMFLAWGLPANAASGGELLNQGLGKHVGERIVQGQEGHGSTTILEYILLLPAYLPMLWVGLGAWSMLLPLMVRSAVREKWWNQPWGSVLMAWVVPSFVLFSLVATKLPHYILPTYPAICIGMAMVLVSYSQQRTKQTKQANAESDQERLWWLRFGGWFYVGGCLSVGIGMLMLPHVVQGSLAEIGQAMLVPGMVMVAVGVGVAWWMVRGVAERAALVGLVGSVAFMLLMASQVFPVIETQLKPAPQMAKVIEQVETSGEVRSPITIWTEGYREPSLMFYFDRPIGMPILRLRESVQDWANSTEPGLLVIRERDLLEDLKGDAVDLTVLPSIIDLGRWEIVNYSDEGEPKVLYLLGRNLPEHSLPER